MKIDYDVFNNSRDGRWSRHDRTIVNDILNPRSGWWEIFKNRADARAAEDNK
jgi:hypothetical protein